MNRDVNASGPYRALFDHVAVGAAQCRVEADGTVSVITANAAFSALREELPSIGESPSVADPDLPSIALLQSHAEPALSTLANFVPVAELITEVRDRAAPLARRIDHDGRMLAAQALPLVGNDVLLVIEDVTAQIEVEASAWQWENRFHQAFHGNAAAMVIADRADLRIIDVNPRWLELFGATRDDVIGKTTLELGLIDPEIARTRISEHAHHADGFDSELALRTRQGKDITVIASARPITISEGRCTLTTLIDITARLHAEHAFATVFSASPAGMVLTSAETEHIVAVNRRLVDMTGYSEDELVGASGTIFDSIIVSADRAALLAEISRAGRLDGTELELRRKDGSTVWALLSTELVTLDTTPHRLSVFTDISTRKRFEQRLLVQDAIGRTLAESSDLATAIPLVLETLCKGEFWDCGAAWLPHREATQSVACCGMWASDAATNPQLVALADRTVPIRTNGILGGVLTRGSVEKSILDPDRGALSRALSKAGMCIAVAFPIRRGADVLGVVALASRSTPNITPTLDASERGLLEAIGRMLGLFIERVRAEGSLRELNHDLERRVQQRTAALQTTNKDLEAFTFTVSHDLRAPLRAIYAFSGALVEDHAAALPPDASRLLTRIHEAGGRMRQQIDDLLTFAKLGREGVKMRDVDLDRLVRNIIDELLDQRGLADKLDLTISPLGNCYGDSALLRTVWMNLIDNAIKYSRTRERTVIDIGTTKSAKGETIYQIRDNGVGFDPRYANKLFMVFQRLHAPTEFEGTGIGLASVRRIVERHQGRIWASSEVDKGSTFEFTLGTEFA